jgi:hypothetical protein
LREVFRGRVIPSTIRVIISTVKLQATATAATTEATTATIDCNVTARQRGRRDRGRARARAILSTSSRLGQLFFINLFFFFLCTSVAALRSRCLSWLALLWRGCRHKKLVIEHSFIVEGLALSITRVLLTLIMLKTPY